MSDEFSYACAGCRQPIDDPRDPDVIPMWRLLDVPGSGRPGDWIPLEGWMAHRRCAPRIVGSRAASIDLEQPHGPGKGDKRPGGSVRQFVRSLTRAKRVAQ